MDENRHKQRIADKKIASKFKRNPPTALAVVVGKSGLAYRRPEGRGVRSAHHGAQGVTVFDNGVYLRGDETTNEV